MGIGKWKIGLLLFVVLWLSSAGASAADTGTRRVLPKFTVAEQQWLSSRARIWIGTMEAWPPMNFVNADGEPDGIGADYIREMNRLLDDRLEIVPAPFKINLEKVKHGELDAIMDITPTEDRKAYLDFTRIYLDIPHVMVGPREGPYYGSEADLSGKTIALEKGFYNIVYFQKNFPDVNIRIYPDTALALDAVARGEVDAYAGNRAVAAHIMEKELMATLKFHGRLNKMGSVLAIAVPKDRPELAGILDKTIAAIPKDRKQAIRRKWAGLTAAVDTSEDLPLTEEEKDWLAAHPKIRVHNEKDWPPFNYFEHGSPRGFSIDYMNLLADRLGIEIDYVTGPSWNDFLEMVQERDLDVMLNIVKTRDRQAYLLYTPPYVKNPNVIVSRENTPFDTVRSLIGRTVAIPKGFFYEEVLGRSFPGIKLLLLEDTLSCLKAVVYGRADATLGEAAVVQSMTARNMLTGLHISGEVEIGNPDLVNLRLGVRKDWPLFRSALQKAMASVLPAEIQQIREKWMIRGDGLSGRLSLTTEELAWVRNHPRIRANGGALAPFIISGQKGGRKGISVDILNLAAGLAGMSVDYVDGTWPQAMEMFRAGELDVLHCVSKTRDRDVFMSFTPPYLSLSAAVYVRKGNDTITGVPDLEGKTLAVTRLSHFYETIKADYPKINLMPVNSGAEGLKKVSTGAADAFVGNQVAAQYEIETGFIQNLRVAAYWETLRGDMRFGVAKDAVVLQGILQKALSALPADKKRRIISRYVSQAQRTQVSVIERLPVDFKTLGITGGIVLVVVAAVFFLLIRMMRKESVAMSFGSPLFRGMVVVGLGVFIIVVAGLGWLLMERTRQAVIGNTESHLKLVLSLIQDRTQMWLEERTALMQRLGKDPELVAITRRLLEVPPQKDALLASDALADARAFFRSSPEMFQNIGFFIISPERVSLGSMRDTNIGTRNLIADQYPELVARAFQGEAGFVPPMTSDVHLAGARNRDRKPPTMFFISPIQDVGGNILAVMTLRIDPVRDLSKLTRSPGRWKTDDLYAFDRSGRMLSSSRFEDQLRDIGLLGPDESSALSIELRDPGVDLTREHRMITDFQDLPLTRLAEQAVALRRQMTDLGIGHGVSTVGVDMKGYRDYRGVPVFGAWLWSRDLEVGLAAEIDVAEAMAGFYWIRQTVFGILGGTLILSVFSVLLVLVLGERSRRVQETARQNLEAKVAERTLELQENQERFAALLESAPDAMVVSDQDGEIVLVNSQAEHLLAYDRSELLGASVDMLVPDNIRDTHYQNRAHFFNNPEIREKGRAGLELTARSKDGTLIPVEISLSPIKSRSGIVVVASIRDITERKEAEAALRASEESFRLILESVGDGIFGVDTGGCVTFVNPSAGRLLGYEADELIARPIHDKIHHTHPDGSHYPVEDCPMFRAYSKGTQETISDEMLWRKDGTGFHVEYSAVPVIKDGRISGAVITFRDITERRAMEAVLAGEREQLQNILDTSPVGVAIATGDVVRFANPRFADMFDVREGDDTPDLYVEDRDRDRINTALAAGRRIDNMELKMIGKNRQIRDMLVTYMTIDYDGETGGLGWVLDITDRKRAEQEIRDRLDELNRFRQLAVGRENKMIQLKKEINELSGRLGEAHRYKIVGTDDTGDADA